MTTKYPTKKEILTAKPLFKNSDLNLIKKWKKEKWKITITNQEKIIAIKQLIFSFCKKYNIEIEIQTNNKIAKYSEKKKKIYLKNTSIITALHETSHAIFGKSETTACVWSIQLFSLTFPKAYNQLKWKRHMLLKK